MHKIHLGMAALLLAFGATGSAQAQVWKCTINGKVQYSDQPCPTQGEQLKSHTLQGNVIDTSADRAAAERQAAERAKAEAGANGDQPGRPGTAQAPANVCPSDRDITAMETKANSISLSPEAKRFIQDEVRRARQCQKGKGVYTAADWAISKQAVDAQGNLTGSADARRRAEGMHSAADAAEGDRIARQREADQRDAAIRRARGETTMGSWR